jgi:PAS domain S-box-containing protein
MDSQVEERLRRYELLIAYSRDIILFVRRGDGCILDANAAATKAYGYSRDELLALTIHDLRAADTKSLTVDQLAQADARGILFETVHRRKDDSTFPVEVSSQGATIDGTRTLISIIRDITERRSTEAKILSLARYPEENPNPILSATGQGTLLYANAPAHAMMEPMGWREGSPLPESLLVPVQDVLNKGRCMEIELTCRLGKVWSLALLPNVSGRQVTLYARDITAQKEAERSLRESEERFRQLTDAMPQLAWTASPDGRVDYLNRRIGEFQRRSQMTPVIHPEDLPRTLKAWQRGIKSGRDYEIEHRLQRADGGFRWFLSRAVPVCDEAGCVIKWFGTSTDVDDRKQAEQTLLRSRDELEEKVRERTAELLLLLADLEKSRDDLRKLASERVLAEERERKSIAVTLHDEVAQTLAAARMRLDMLRSLNGGEECREIIEQAQELLSHCIRQTRALMTDISNPVLYDMGLRSAVEALAEPIKARHGIHVKCSFEGNLNSLSQDLNVMVFQVVKELLQNVVKHSGARGASIRIAEDKHSIRTVVADDGVGFDTAVTSSADSIEGGFGLFSIRERVKSFDGDIRIKSKAGIGSEVSVMLPKTAAGKQASGKTGKKEKRDKAE